MKTLRLRASRSGVLAFALLLAGSFSGCTSVQVTNDNNTIGEYKLGYLIVQPLQTFATVRDATRKAFKDMGYFLVQDELDVPGSCELRARTPNDTTVIVKLKSFSAYTNVKIRHGLRGELAPEQQLYQAIARHF
ncbi:MAG: DUF3568 family protein [Opitutaceae bacterium]